MGISAIVIALEEGEHLRHTVGQLVGTLPGGSEILVVDDGSTDGCADFLLQEDAPARLIRGGGLGVAGARNRGAAESKGDILLFVDAHMTLPAGWWEPLVELLDRPGVAAAAPGVRDVEQTHRKGFGLRLKMPDLTAEWLSKGDSAPRPVPIVPGCSVAMRREVFSAAGRYDAGMIRSQGIDNEFCLRLWLLGYECWIAPQVEVVHLFRDRHPYLLDWETVIHNRLRLALLHLEETRLTQALDSLRRHAAFPGALALAADSDVLTRRAALAACRKRSAASFFERFGGEA